jgi:hypothetical protein
MQPLPHVQGQQNALLVRAPWLLVRALQVASHRVARRCLDDGRHHVQKSCEGRSATRQFFRPVSLQPAPLTSPLATISPQRSRRRRPIVNQ